MYSLLLVMVASLHGAMAASHPEVRGEHPDQDDIDNGQCIPIFCTLGVPPAECTRQCALQHYIPICKPPNNYCLCQRLVGNTVELVSPDEVEEPQEPSAPAPTAPTDVHHTFTVYAIFVPLKNFFYEKSSSEVSTIQPSAETLALEVNVHEGRLFWDFRYILSGLLILMIGLIVYEIIMCRVQNYEKAQDSKGPKLKILNV